MVTKNEALSQLKKREAQRILAKKKLYDYIRYTFRTYKNPNWHHKLIADYYQRVIQKKILRLMVFAPPRHMKTEGAERAMSYAFGNDPDERIISCAYGESRASKTSRNVKSNIRDKNHIQVFPKFAEIDTRNAIDMQAKWEIGGDYKGGFLASGIGGAIMGEGFTLGYIDDPVKSREDAESENSQTKTFEWYGGTFLNRQDELDSRIMLTNTRWNRKDLAGQILEQDGIRSYNGHVPSEGCPEWNEMSDGLWDVLCLSAEMDDEAWRWKHKDDPRKIGDALWPARFPMSFLQQFKANKYDWYSLYQQRPQPKGGNIINRAWFKLIDVLPNVDDMAFVRFWDFAGTEKKTANDPDFTAGALVGYLDGNVYLCDMVAIRGTPKTVEDMVVHTAQMDEDQYGDVMQVWEEEGGASGKHVSSYYLKLLGKYTRKEYRTGRAKHFYVDRLANKAETGNVYCLKGAWLHKKCDGNTFFDEAEEFDKGRHDDRLDAASKGTHVLVGDDIKIRSL